MTIFHPPQYFTLDRPYSAGDVFVSLTVDNPSYPGNQPAFLEANPITPAAAAFRGTSITVSYKCDPAKGPAELSINLTDSDYNTLLQSSPHVPLISDGAYHTVVLPFVVPQTGDLNRLDLQIYSPDGSQLDSAFTLHDVGLGAAAPVAFWTRDVLCLET